MIRVIAAVVFALLPLSASAQEVLSVPGLADLVAQKAKETKACGILDLNGKASGGVYLPIWTFHDLGGTDYFETGIGASKASAESARALLVLGANLPGLSSRLWSSEWARGHLTRTALPPLFFGPSLRIPLPADHFQWRDWRDFLNFYAAIRIGS